MTRTKQWTTALLVAIAWSAGCGAPEQPTSADKGEQDEQTANGHSHASGGPHGGQLVDLAEDYHAEIVHDDDAGTLTVYVLDSTAKDVVPIEASEVTINLTHDGQPEQFVLAADPQEDDPEGQSSRFVSSEPELGDRLHHDDANARLLLEIAGKSYNGKIEHDHGDGEHGHDH